MCNTEWNTKEWNESNFIIKKTRCGCSLRWRHNNKNIRRFYGTDCIKRAKRFIDFLIKWRKENPKIGMLIENRRKLI